MLIMYIYSDYISYFINPQPFTIKKPLLIIDTLDFKRYVAIFANNYEKHFHNTSSFSSSLPSR